MVMKFTNNATSTLAAGITNVATSLSVAAGTGLLYPTLAAGDYFWCTLANLLGAVEIVKVTARTGDVFTLVRGQDGTAAVAWNLGDKVELRLVAASLNDIPKLDEANTFTGLNTFINPINTEQGLTQYYMPSLDGNFRDLYRAGWLPYCFNQQWGGSQWGNLPDGSFGSVATGNIQADANYNIGSAAGTYYAATGFKVAENLATFAPWLKLYKVGNPTGNVSVAIYADSGGSPTGAPLGGLTISAKQLTSKTDGEWYTTGVFNTALTAGVQYHLVINIGLVDASNFVNWLATSTKKYPHGFGNTGTSAPVWTQFTSFGGCFLIQNPAANSLLQSGGMFDYKLAFNPGTPWNQSRFLSQPVSNFISGDTLTFLHRGTYTVSSTVVDFTYGIDHDRVTVTINASGFPVLTIYRSDRTAYTVTGAASVAAGNHDIACKVDLVGAGADTAYLYVDGVSVGTPLTAQTFSMDTNFKLLGTAILGGGFPLAPTWTQDMQMASLPSAQGWTWTGTGTEANCMSVAGGKLYQNANGYTSTQTGYYSKTPTLTNAAGWTVAAKVRVANEPNTLGAVPALIQGVDAVTGAYIELHEYFIVLVTSASSRIFQGDFKSQDNVITLHVKGADAYVLVNGKLAIDGTGIAVGGGGANVINFGDASATASQNADVIWSYVKYYQGGMILPTANTGSCSEFAHWSGDKSALLPSLYNAGTPVSVKQLCGVPRNYQYEAGVQSIVQKGVTSSPTTTSLGMVVVPDLECYVIGSAFEIASTLITANSGTSYAYLGYRVDGGFSSDVYVAASLAAAATAITLNGSSPRYSPLGLHKVEVCWRVDSGTETAYLINRSSQVTARS